MKYPIQLLCFSIILSMLACQDTTETMENTNEVTAFAYTTPPHQSGGLYLPNDFEANVFIDSLTRNVRHITVRDNGDVYVKLSRLNSDGKGIVALRDTDNDGQADDVQSFGNYTGTGMDIYNNYLYAASDVAVYRYPLVDGQLLPDSTAVETVVEGFPDQVTHEAKSITFDNDGNIYVNVGAPSNACQVEDRQLDSPGQDPCPLLERHCGIWRFDANTPNQTQEGDGHRYATGMRNAVALEWNTASNSLYALQHGRDQLSHLFADQYNTLESAELPAEEFFKISDGDDFGWPYCYFDPFQNKKVLAPEYGGDGKIQERCADKAQPIVAFPAHLAPNDLLFYKGTTFPEKYQNGAFIAFHGSWNRAPEPQAGYFVVFVPLGADGLPSGDWEVFADGFSQNDNFLSPGDATYRPCGLAQGADGALYVSDSRKGKIWKIQYKG